MKNRIKKPTFPKVTSFSVEEIRGIIKGFGPKMTQEKFGRFFPVSLPTVKAWLSGRNPPYGPCSVRLAELKEYVDHVAAKKRAVLDKVLNSMESK